MRFFAMISLALLAAGCAGKKNSNCELKVNDVTVCLEREASVAYCEDTWGGTATVHDGTDDPTCEDMGYVLCEQGKVADSDGTQYTFYAPTAEDCAAAAGGAF